MSCSETRKWRTEFLNKKQLDKEEVDNKEILICSNKTLITQTYAVPQTKLNVSAVIALMVFISYIY